MEYIIVEVGRGFDWERSKKIVELVNKKIQEGWIPKGGIQVVKQNDSLKFYQAMVRITK
jgi:hypothetical protein